MPIDFVILYKFAMLFLLDIYKTLAYNDGVLLLNVYCRKYAAILCTIFGENIKGDNL